MHNAPDMSTPKPGEIRCPTCHRSTPPAAFCTQCGAAIPSDARVRPRGMDRDELQDRIRQRRAGGDPYRRGVPADEPSGAPGYQRFEPEAEDTAAARRAEEGMAAPRADYFAEREAPRPDITRDREPDHYGAWPQQEHAPPPPEPPRSEEPYYEAPRSEAPRYEDPSYVEPERGDYDQAADYEQSYAYGDEWGGGRRGSGLGPVVILGFLALGVLALLGGAVLAGVFDDDGTGSATQSPTASVEPTLAPSTDVTPTPVVPTDSGGGSPPPTDGPVTFPDGFIGDIEPCATEEMDFPGCTEDGSSITSDRMWVWIGFTNAQGTDELVLRLQFGGQTIGQSPFVMGETVRCPETCDGYLRQGYTGLNPGDYELILERNGEFADRASFTVAS